MQWYTFKLSSDDEAGFNDVKQVFNDLLSKCEGIMGTALFYKINIITKENIFFAVIPVSMTDVAESAFRQFRLKPCGRPTGKELTQLLSSTKEFDDYSDVCKTPEV